MSRRSRQTMEELARTVQLRHFDDTNGPKYGPPSPPNIDKKVSLEELKSRLRKVRTRLTKAMSKMSDVECVARHDFLPYKWHKESGAISSSIKVQELKAEEKAVADRISELLRFTDEPE